MALPSLHFFTVPIIAEKTIFALSSFKKSEIPENGFPEPFFSV